MEKRDIIVIGVSAGGYNAIREMVARLPADLQASIFIVWHIAPEVRGILPEVLNRQNTLPATHAVDFEPVKRGHIYVAPPDHHMLVEKNRIRVTRGPKENRFRPAIDPLFRSAAFSYRTRVIGIVLSGALDDGTAGLWTVKHYGGLAIVQDPLDAEVASMPENALKAVNVDFVVPVSDIAGLISQLVGEPVEPGHEENGTGTRRLKAEINIAMEDNPLNAHVVQLGELTPYTCPECHGVLTAFSEGGRVRFRCHTGHAFSGDSLLAAITETIEEGLWNAIRNMQESVMLLNHMGDHFAEINQPKLAAAYFRKAKEAEIRASIVRQAVVDHEHLSTEAIEGQKEFKKLDEL